MAEASGDQASWVMSCASSCVLCVSSRGGWFGPEIQRLWRPSASSTQAKRLPVGAAVSEVEYGALRTCCRVNGLASDECSAGVAREAIKSVAAKLIGRG